MPVTLTEAITEFITLWVVIDPIGSVAIFVAITAGMTASIKRQVAWRAVMFAAAILFAFVVAGQLLLQGMGISLLSFQIAGGLVLFVFGLRMTFGEVEAKSMEEEQEATPTDFAVFPLAIPSIAGPGAMLSVVLLTDNDRHSIPDQAVTVGLMMAVLAITLMLLLAAGWIYRLIGEAGASITSRVMGLILTAVAVDTVLNALRGLNIIQSPV